VIPGLPKRNPGLEFVNAFSVSVFIFLHFVYEFRKLKLMAILDPLEHFSALAL
jgi:hypothetical protein